MNRRGIFTSMAVAVGVCVVPVFDTPTPVSAEATFTAALYNMNESAGSTVLVDSSGNGLNGAIGPNAVAGVVFDGATAHRFLNRSPNLPPAEPERLDTAPSYTLENPDSQDFKVTVRYRTSKKFGNLIQKGQNGTVGGYFKIELPNGRPTCLFKGTQNGQIVQRGVEAPIGYELNDNTWHTISCERLQTRVALWIDGVEVKRLVGWSGNISNPKNLSIAGKSNCDQGETTCDYFVGDIDWVQIQKGSTGTTNPPPIASFTSTCTTPLACSFNGSASSDPGGSIASYGWDFGDGGLGTGVSPSHTYTAAGSYLVRLTVTDNQNSTGTITHTVVVAANPPPSAAFTSTCTNLSCTFNASGSTDNGSITSYAWNFGDGTPAGSGVNPTHPYAVGGTYNVQLTVTDNQGATGSITHPVVLNTPPIAAFTSTCTVLSCTFDASGSTDNGSITSYAWNFGDLTTAGSGVNPTHPYAAAGTYNVQLTVTDNQGVTGTITHSVVVNPAPIAAFSSTCSDLSCTFDASGSTDNGSIASYSWDFGDSTPLGSGIGPTHPYATAGSYLVQLTVTDNQGATATITHTVVLNGPPNAAFTFTCADYTCSFDGTTSTDPNGPIAEYAWDFGDTVDITPGSGATTSHLYPGPGTYTVVLSVTDVPGGLPNGTVEHDVTVLDNVAPVASYTTDCDDLTCTFTSTSTDANGPISSYVWDFDDTTTGTGASISHTFSAAGDYDVKLTVADAFTASDDETTTVNVHDTVVIAFVAGASVSPVNAATTHTVVVPTAVQAGDGLVLFLTIGATATISTPTGVTGWTQLGTVTGGTGTTRVWRKVAGATDAGAPVSISLSATSKASLTIMAYRGTSAIDPVASFASSVQTTSTATRTTPVATVAGTTSWALSYWVQRDSVGASLTPPGGVTVRTGSSSGGTGTRLVTLVADSNGTVPGPTYGGRTATASAAGSFGTTWTIVLASA